MLTLKMVVGKIWSFNLFLKLHIIFGVGLKYFMWNSYCMLRYVHLTAYLAFFICDDILTTGVLTKQSKNVLFI